MTFSKPQTAVFSYEGIIPSQTMNNINNDIPNCLDKTGDNATNSGGVTGRIDWLVGSSLIMDGYLSVDGKGVFGQASVVFANGALWQISSTGAGSVYGEIDVKGGGEINWDSGSTGQFDAGSLLKMNGTMTVQSAGLINCNGDQIVVQDNTFPIFANTQSRNIEQPLMAHGVLSSDLGYAVTDQSDVSGGFVFWMPFTKMLLGTTLTRVDLNYNVTSSHTPSIAAIIQLYKMKPYVGLSSLVLIASASANTGVSGQQQTSLLSLTEVIDDSQYVYGIRITAESGTSCQNIQWYACGTTFAINNLGPY